MIRVLVADDHPVVRHGLVQILTAQPGVHVAGEAANAGEVLDRLAATPADVLLLDIAMPGRSGLELLDELRKLYPRLPVLILSQYPENQIAVRAIRAGASGYLTKESPPDVLVKAIHRIYEGKRYITESLAELLADTVGKTVNLPHEALSDREYQILCLIASGKTVSLIAEQLHLSVKTVSTYRSRVLEKMTMRTNAELTRYAIENNLI
jgi:DNA-binding NarL/FixJ family response regulator